MFTIYQIKEAHAKVKSSADFPSYGVEKWVIDLSAMTCAYHDKAGNEMLVATIPAP